MGKQVTITDSGMLFIRTRYYGDVNEVFVMQGAQKAKRFFKERPHGEWIHSPYGYLSAYKCSNCGDYGNQLWHFCANCGADMREKE